MSAAFPNAFDNLSNPAPGDSQSTGHAQQHANLNDIVEAIEAELGVNPKGSQASVAARMSAIETANAALSGTAFNAIVDGTITGAKLAATTIPAGKLGVDSVVATNLATDSVSTGKIQNNAVTTAKLASTIMTGYKCTSTTRPAGSAGMRIYETDTLRTLDHDGTNWIIMSEPAQSWTPAVSGFTIGTGGSAQAIGYYKRSDGWIEISGLLVLGTSGQSVGITTLTLPVAASSLRSGQLNISFFQSPNYYPGVNIAGTTTSQLAVTNVGSTYPFLVNTSSTVPVTWVASGALEISGTYRMTTRYS